MNCGRSARIVLCTAAGGLLFMGLFLLLNAAPHVARANPGDLFVTPGGSGDCSRASPCALQTALGVAVDGDAIYIAEGTYTGSGAAVITVDDSIALYGGWNGAATGPVVCDPDAYPTTIDGQGARRGVVVGSGLTVSLEGFTIANGVDTFQGAGLYAHDAHLTLRHMTVYSNVIDVYSTPGSYAYGSGAMVAGGTLVVEASTFRANSAWAATASLGGGLAISATTVATVTGSVFQDNDAWHASGLYFRGASGSHAPLTLLNSVFLGNGRGRSAGSASGGYAGAFEVSRARAHIEGNRISDSDACNDYGAVAVFSSDLLLTRNTIIGNDGARTSALYLSGNNAFTATNNIIAGNRSTYYWLPDNPAVTLRANDGQFLHNTIARNDSTYGVVLLDGSTVWLTNTILVSHTVGITVAVGSTARLQATMWGSGAWGNGTDWVANGTISIGTVNIWGDPAFVDPDAGDYHIAVTSAAFDAGVDAGITIDIDGDMRPMRAGYDIGADEWAAHVYLPLVLRSYP